ncbi:transglutaminase family protein [Psychromarinibacter sp. S121]|uniref:transglutaminase family protein n=1 Tax=Psychromarinibacter sp. S121 TaxID=3415127 RepID=UPI003C7DC2DE
MRFSVRHATVYRYSEPVRFGTHRLRLSPRGQNVALHYQEIHVAPEPATRRDALDPFGNPVTELEFGHSADLLAFESAFELDTIAPPPVSRADLPPLPWPRGTGEPAYLPAAAADPAVTAFAEEIVRTSDWEAAAFLERLNETLFSRTDRHIRPDGAAQPAAVTLRTARGACRDLTVLFMEAARTQGIPARFVSGYQAHAESVDGQRHLHAWPEVFLPGHGWQGYDPTHGLPVTDGHVALSAAPDQAATMPVEGGFYGTGVTSELDYEVEIYAD